MRHAKLKKALPYIVLSILAIVFALPLVWVVLASLDLNASSGVKIPSSFTIQNYIDVIKSQTNQRALKNGLYISLVQSLIVVFVSILAAYPLSRFELKCKKIFMLTILFMTALPMTAVMVPVYKMFLTIKLYNSIPGVILFMTATSLPYGIWLMKNSMDGVPMELEEAAKVDGATTLTSIFKVIVPLMFPGICVVFIYTFSGSWGNFFVPYILLSTAEKMPASVQLYQFFGQNGMVVYGQLAAYSALYALPSIILYVLSQSYMSKGFNLSGAAKG
ncbi:carbohydrate ABC transporter membrane protein 2, CUT1 family [Lachnospiraceae bacterium KH1T2]|nr:carbohydrate ABC transporter membrane protein 2, CUT1 family [Lachnospiraceae bacterium KH1T2]